MDLNHPKEIERLEALRSLDILDTPPEENYDAVVQLASEICNTPISTITLIDEDRQWFKAKVGVQRSEDPRTISFCAHCILNEEILEVTDTHKDARFQNNPLVTDGPRIRFYAGAPLYTSSGLPIGSLCVIDKEPRTLTKLQRQTLTTLAQQVSSELELRLSNKRLTEKNTEVEQLNSNLQQLFRVIAHDLRSPFQGFLGITQMIEESYDDFTAKDILEYIELLGDSASDTYNLLENLLEWSTLEVGDQRYRPKLQCLKELVDNSLNAVRVSAKKKSIELVNEIDSGLSVKVDTKMIASVIRNLINNAIKFSPEQSQITLNAQSDQSTTLLTIEDQGHGMEQSLVDRIRQKESVESTTGTNGEHGSGIGLHLVHTFLDQHDSQLEIASTVGSGTQMSFHLPN